MLFGTDLFPETFPLDHHVLIAKFSNDKAGAFYIFFFLHEFQKFILLKNLICGMKLRMWGSADVVFFYPGTYRYMGDAENSFDLPERKSFQIQLQGFCNIVVVNLFSQFFYGEIIITVAAPEPLSFLYNSAFYYVVLLAFGTGIWHNYTFLANVY